MTPSRLGAGRVPVFFDDPAWTSDLQRLTVPARAAAARWRRIVEVDGVAVDQLRRCDPEGRDNTRLAGCVKVYVPALDGPWGAVLRLVFDADGGHLDVLAFGLRHPPTPRRPSVYQLAHRRLHGDTG